MYQYKFLFSNYFALLELKIQLNHYFLKIWAEKTSKTCI